MLEIKLAREKDADTLAELSTRTFVETFIHDNKKEDIDQYVASTFGPDKQFLEIRDPNRHIEIAWSDNRAVGFVHLAESEPDASVTGPKPVELLRLYVDSRWHGQGIGSALMNRGIEIARREGFQTLWLGVWERNFKAQAFYHKYQFEKVGSHIFAVGTDEQIDWIMARSI